MELPPLLGADAALAKRLRLMYWHSHLAEWGYWLIGLHSAAALLHHYVAKDNALLRMLPRVVPWPRPREQLPCFAA